MASNSVERDSKKKPEPLIEEEEEKVQYNQMTNIQKKERTFQEEDMSPEPMQNYYDLDESSSD